MKERNIGLEFEPPILDLRVKMVFDEDFRTMVFPRVKQFIFRVNSNSPFEVAAKALAIKNGHPELWPHYSFSIMMKPNVDRQASEDSETTALYSKEVEIKDMRKCFVSFNKDHFSDKHSGENDELVFFYKINCSFESPFSTTKPQVP
jgi:hypothetical protein